MHNKEEIFSQALKDTNAIHEQKPLGYSVINYGVKIQKFPSKIEILNCSKSGDYFQECSDDEYEMFFIHGWRKGGLRLSMMNCKRKLDLIEERIKKEVNTRKNDKHIQKLKTSRENLLIKYSKRNKQLNKLTNGKEKEHF
tara:strand:- start:583 stop:1002 length:420 start_codon:yes stop_codon:yes gene_type:complete